MQVATPQSELYEKLLGLGWTLSKIDFKNGVYVAKANNETTGQEIDRAGKTPEMAVASVFQYAQRAYEVRRRASVRQVVTAWTDDFLNDKEEIAKAYSAMPPFDEKAVPAWKALAAESKVQADMIRSQITVEVVDDPEPYRSAAEMCEDVHKNKHFAVSRANTSHPVWSEEDNVNFRIVHDVIGHCQSGGDFSWRGENLACGVHFPIISPLAREACFTECIGQTAYRSFYRGFGPQKVGFLSQFLHPVQERQGEHVWVPHGGLPQLSPSPNGNAGKDMLDQAAGLQGIFNSPGNWVQPSQFDIPQAAPPSPTFGLGTPVMQPFTVKTHDVEAAKMVSPDRPYDPNHFWTPMVQAPPLEDPSQDYIGIGDTFDNASKVDTNWPEEDEATQKRAIMNAFRVALLSPRKHLKWNAAHYQAIMNADPSTKAVDLWNMLEEERERHNQKLGYPEGSHLAYRKQLGFLAHELRADDPSLSEADSMKKAKEIVFNKTKEIEEQLGADPANEGTSELRRYNMARRMVTDWLREFYTPLRGWQPGQMALAGFGDTHPPDRAIPALSEREQKLLEDTTSLLPESEWPSWIKRYLGLQTELALRGIQNDTTPSDLTFPDQWAAKTAEYAIPNKVYEQAAYDHQCPMCRGYLRDRGGIYTCSQCPFEYNAAEKSQVGLKAAGQQLFPTDDEWRPIDQSGFASEDAKYGAFMGTHLDAIAEVGQHIDQIREAALRDIAEDSGKGFVFRNAVMNMNLKGVNPKVASFAWLLLAPTSSELGIIDTHIIRGLRRSENDMTPRDYYKFERMQRAAKDATGYSHMPLGMYHWGLWDAIRNPGEHSDHAPLRVLDPLPWDSPETKWDAATTAKSGPWVGPMQFENARGHMEQAAREFDNEMAGQPQNLIPLATPPHRPEPSRHNPYVIPVL